MIAVDVGVLAFAVNRHAPGHRRAAAVLEELMNGDRPWALPWPALHDFLGLVTHSHGVARPLRPEEAVGFLEPLLASPSAKALGPTVRHAAVLRELLEGEAAGALPVGIELAAVLREHGVRELLSTDPRMRRYGFLSVIDPLEDESWTPGARPVRRYRTLGGGAARER